MYALVNGDGCIFEVRSTPFPVARPLDWVEVPDGTTTADTWDGTTSTVVPAGPDAPTVDDIKSERARRLALGFDYDFGAGGVHRIGTTAADMAGWSEVTDYARALTSAGDATTTIDIVTDTGPVAVTAPEWEAVLRAAAAFRQPIWAASFMLMDMDPIPIDYADDKWWP